MDRNPISQAVGLALAPARLAGRVAATVVRETTRRPREPRPEPPRPTPAPAPPPAPMPRRPKDLDDVAIARKVESVIFRGRRVAKGKVDVNVADGVVWLRGEVKTPDLVKQLEAKAREVPEVKRVENLLHLPKTPAPSRTDTPASQRKTRRTKPSPAARPVTPSGVSDEAPAPTGAEPSPKEVAATGGGRRPAPLGSQDDEKAPAKPEADGPDTADLDDDPAYNPTSAGLRDLKGG
jgi:hypothetical protein